MRAFQLFFLGTFAPFFRASDKPIAIACFRVFTTPPLPPFPERSLPRFSRAKALFTLALAALPYFAIAPPSFFRAFRGYSNRDALAIRKLLPVGERSNLELAAPRSLASYAHDNGSRISDAA
jgi:hypothetical protein